MVLARKKVSDYIAEVGRTKIILSDHVSLFTSNTWSETLGSENILVKSRMGEKEKKKMCIRDRGRATGINKKTMINHQLSTKRLKKFSCYTTVPMWLVK